MTFEVDEKRKMLFKEGAEAIRNQDWEAVDQVACYDDEMGNYMLAMYEERLPLEVKCRIALYHYSNHGDFYPSVRKYVRKAGIIRPENWREELPSSVRNLDTFTVYRGGSEDNKKAACSMSWTLSQETAEWFMKRHELTHPGQQHLYKGTIAADKVIAYMGGRKEYEIVQYRGVRNIEEISPAGCSVDFQSMRNSGDIHYPVSQEMVNAYFDKWYGSTRQM